MERVYNELTSIINSFYTKYKDLDENIASPQPTDREWSPKEIIGHLIDSASNNHQRFIRLQLIDELIFPDYFPDNKRWVEIAHYTEMDFADLLLLWKHYNLLIARIIRTVDPETLDNCWLLDGNKITLDFLIRDYLAHLQNHLQQFHDTVGHVNGR